MSSVLPEQAFDTSPMGGELYGTADPVDMFGLGIGGFNGTSCCEH